MDEQQRKAMLKETFDTVSSGYDNAALRFFPDSARYMAALPGFRGDEHVLDVACGTGHASLAVARLLPRGRVTAVDFSTGMLEQARKKAATLNVRNIDFIERDMQALGFDDDFFDAAVCSFGIFFVEDMDRQLAHITKTVRPGGKVMISNFQESYFQPLREMMVSRLLQYGVQVPPQTWTRIASEAGCRELFEKTGLGQIRVKKKNVGYFIQDPGQWWDVIWNAGFRRMISQLTPPDRERFKLEHLQEVDRLRTDKGIWLDIGVLYTIGVRPERPKN